MTLLSERKTVPDVSLQMVFRTIAEFALKLNKKKCEIHEPKVCYFGNVITEKGLGPDPEKVIAFEELPVPKNVSELRQLLGMIIIAKKILKQRDPFLLLMSCRATPYTSTGLSPCQLMTGREIRTP